jgi:DNA polymerase I-like protein with 3'-5' exonuclease and polymerase domains
MKQGDNIMITGNTFGPLYGKHTEWTKQFYALFPGIAEWHKRLMDEAVTTKEIRTPSGRIYAFPDTQRYMKRDGTISVSGHTQIKNYPVQGFATGDIVLLVMIDIYKYLRKHNANSRVILQVHDSATSDAHPDEIDLVVAAYRYAFDNVYAHDKERFGIDINVPLAFDLTIGDNWLEQEAIEHT